VSSEIVGVEDDAGAVARLRRVMWESVGVMRHDGGLRTALAEIDALTPRLAAGATGRNLATIARTVTTAALARTESRGGHHRTDHPDTSPRWALHTVLEIAPEPRHRLRTRLGAA
jgi:L-aspartate oxidase